MENSQTHTLGKHDPASDTDIPQCGVTRPKIINRSYKNILFDLFSHPRFQSASVEGKMSFLEFAIEVLKMDIQGDYFSGFLWNSSFVNAKRLLPIGVLEKKEEKTIRLSLEDVCVVSFPYNPERILLAVDDIKHEGFVPLKNDTKGWYFPEINLAIVYEGQHHVSAAVVMNKPCSAIVMEISLKDSFDSVFVSSDGKRWERKGTDGEIIISCPVDDIRFVLLFELARFIDKGTGYIDKFLSEFNTEDDVLCQRKSESGGSGGKVSVNISSALFNRVHQMAASTNMKVEDLVENAINDFLPIE